MWPPKVVRFSDLTLETISQTQCPIRITHVPETMTTEELCQMFKEHYPDATVDGYLKSGIRQEQEIKITDFIARFGKRNHTRSKTTTGYGYINDLSIDDYPELANRLRVNLPRGLNPGGPSDSLRFADHTQLKSERKTKYDNHYIYVGTDDSGTKLHRDPLATVAINIVLEGTKVWHFVLEKDPTVLHAVFSKDLFGDGADLDPVVLKSAGILVETIEIPKGEGIVVPSNLPHYVENRGSPWCLAMAYSFLPLTLLEASRQAFLYCRSIRVATKIQFYEMVWQMAKALVNGDHPLRETLSNCTTEDRRVMMGLLEQMLQEEELAVGEATQIDFDPDQTCQLCKQPIWNRHWWFEEGDTRLCPPCGTRFKTEGNAVLHERILLADIHRALDVLKT
eukprot:TRINITY_DN857_c0_g5_i1.p1 TRINITY_DN857_c0_g5~~TRINITY_DN857_c0_g5_i1.p1  ORF type:complete len:394 (+),score=41.32 TRINITY_DN857_c0_g5_i1:229-1410(+)